MSQKIGKLRGTILDGKKSSPQSTRVVQISVFNDETFVFTAFTAIFSELSGFETQYYNAELYPKISALVKLARKIDTYNQRN